MPFIGFFYRFLPIKAENKYIRADEWDEELNIEKGVSMQKQDIIPPDTIKHFLKVPKEVILEKTLSEHRMAVFLYLNYNQTWDSAVHYSPLYMIKWNGYKVNWNRGKKRQNLYTKFRNCMQWYSDNGYIIGFDKGKYSQSIFQSSMLCDDKINPKSNFGLIYDFEIAAIYDYHSPYKPLNRSILLLLLSYIRAFTWGRGETIPRRSLHSSKVKPEIFCSQFKTMASFIGISPAMVSKAVAVLEQLGLIKIHRMSSYQDSCGGWHMGDVIFICPYKYLFKGNQIRKCTDEEYDYKAELEYGISFLSNR